jgi:hypothetical protein
MHVYLVKGLSQQQKGLSLLNRIKDYFFFVTQKRDQVS